MEVQYCYVKNNKSKTMTDNSSERKESLSLFTLKEEVTDDVNVLIIFTYCILRGFI